VYTQFYIRMAIPFQRVLRYPLLHVHSSIAPEIPLTIRIRPALTKPTHGGFVPSRSCAPHMNDGESILRVSSPTLPCLNFSRCSYGCDAGVLDIYPSHYPLMCQFPSENTPNSCNTLQIFCLEVLISPQAQSSSRSA